MHNLATRSLFFANHDERGTMFTRKNAFLENYLFKLLLLIILIRLPTKQIYAIQKW